MTAHPIITHWQAATPTQRLALLLLVLRARSDGTTTTPAFELAGLLGIKARQVWGLLSALEKMGAISRAKTGKGETTITIAPSDKPTAIKLEPHENRLQTQFRDDCNTVHGSSNFIGDGSVPNVSKTGNSGVSLQLNAVLLVRTLLLSYLETSQETSVPVQTNTPHSPSKFRKAGTKIPNAAAPRALAPQPKREGAPTDLLGADVADDPDALLRVAIDTWVAWQRRLGRTPNRNLTSSRRKRFLAAWRGPLHRNMTVWRVVCRACTTNALLAGAVGRWEGATLDWVLFEENLAKILAGAYPPDYDPADPVTRT